jgi:hypothetical protein
MVISKAINSQPMSETFFNPEAKITAFPLGNGQTCWVVDDVLLQPKRLRQFAIDQVAQFQQAPFNAYPGVEFPMPAEITEKINYFFTTHIRRLFNIRRLLKSNTRMAMVTLPPEQLQARQWICHRDSAWVEPTHCISASVLYLFDDPILGGTNFYAPKKPMPEIERFVHDASTMSNETFSAKHAIKPGYYAGGDDYFETIGSVPAKFNRMIFYDGRIFHCGDIHTHERMNPNPATGRLTLNGFFTSSLKSS